MITRYRWTIQASILCTTYGLFRVLTYQNAFINEKTSSETERMFLELSMKLRTEFERFSKLQSNICGDMKEIWAGFSH
jgi:hypothetical protein